MRWSAYLAHVQEVVTAETCLKAQLRIMILMLSKSRPYYLIPAFFSHRALSKNRASISQFDRTLFGTMVNETRFNTAMTPPVYEHLMANREILDRAPLDPEAKNVEQEAWLKAPKDSMGYQTASQFSPAWRQHTMEWTIAARKRWGFD